MAGAELTWCFVCSVFHSNWPGKDVGKEVLAGREVSTEKLPTTVPVGWLTGIVSLLSRSEMEVCAEQERATTTIHTTMCKIKAME